MKPNTLRENVDVFSGADSLTGLVVMLVVWLVILIAAPVIVIVLGFLLLPFEVTLIAGVALALIVFRLLGAIPWTVVIVHGPSHEMRQLRTRNLLKAVRTIREINGDRRVRVRWTW